MREHLHKVYVSLHLFSQLIEKLKEKCSSLPSSHQEALSADADEIMYTTPGDVGIYYDDNGQHLLLFTPRKHLNSCSWC